MPPKLIFKVKQRGSNMASSIEHDPFSAVEHEISCPICYEDFREPKCLPNCAHNVCQQCLQRMKRKRKKVLECPVCRVESVIPKGGVAAFPKNHLLVRWIEQSCGRKEKHYYLKEAVKSCEEKLQGAKGALEEMEKRYINSKTKCDEMKQRVQSLVEGVVKRARKQEQKMLDEIKATYDRNEVAYETLQSRTVKLCENASNRINSAQVIIQHGGSEMERVINTINNLSKSLNISMLEANGKFTQSLELSLTNTDLAEEFIFDEFSLGRLNVKIDQETPIAFTAPPWEALEPKPVKTSKAKDYSRCGSLIQRIGSTSHFDAFSVAASRDCGVIVVLDEDAKFVHTFTKAGKKLNKFHINHGDLWDIVVSNEDEIVVLNRDKNCLLHYDMNGNFQKKIVSAPKENVKFTSCTVDIHGRFIITSYPYCKDEKGNDAMPCVLVYRPCGKLTMSFGKEDLGCPEKAVFLNGRFYVIDSGGCGGRVIVFDKTGSFINMFEDKQLKSPSSIAADHRNGTLAVTDTDTLKVHIYSKSGQQLHCFETENKPADIAFTKNFKSLLVCFEVDDGNGYVEMLTYR